MDVQRLHSLPTTLLRTLATRSYIRHGGRFCISYPLSLVSQIRNHSQSSHRTNSRSSSACELLLWSLIGANSIPWTFSQCFTLGSSTMRSRVQSVQTMHLRRNIPALASSRMNAHISVGDPRPMGCGLVAVAKRMSSSITRARIRSSICDASGATITLVVLAEKQCVGVLRPLTRKDKAGPVLIKPDVQYCTICFSCGLSYRATKHKEDIIFPQKCHCGDSFRHNSMRYRIRPADEYRRNPVKAAHKAKSTLLKAQTENVYNIAEAIVSEESETNNPVPIKPGNRT